MGDAILPLAAIVALAFVVEAAAGFGATIVTVTLAAQLLPVSEILARFVPLNLILSVVLATRSRRQIAWGLLGRKVLPWMGAGTLVGILFGARWRDALGLKAVFGLLVVLLSATELARQLRPRAAPRPPAPAVTTGALVGAGLIHGIFATGGPLAVYAIGHEIADKGAFRATLSTLWIVMNGALLVGLATAGELTAARAVDSLWLLGALGVGALVGDGVHHRLDPKRFRIAVFVLLGFAGGALAVRSALAA